MYEEVFFVTQENAENFLKKSKKIKGELTVIAELIECNEKIYTDEEIIRELKKDSKNFSLNKDK